MRIQEARCDAPGEVVVTGGPEAGSGDRRLRLFSKGLASQLLLN